nr:hypothetical protein [Tanacetum cinerariifolium]
GLPARGLRHGQRVGGKRRAAARQQPALRAAAHRKPFPEGPRAEKQRLRWHCPESRREVRLFAVGARKIGRGRAAAGAAARQERQGAGRNY